MPEMGALLLSTQAMGAPGELLNLALNAGAVAPEGVTNLLPSRSAPSPPRSVSDKTDDPPISSPRSVSINRIMFQHLSLSQMAAQQMESVDNSFMRENDPRMPLLQPDRTTRTSFGKG